MCRAKTMAVSKAPTSSRIVRFCEKASQPQGMKNQRRQKESAFTTGMKGPGSDGPNLGRDFFLHEKLEPSVLISLVLMSSDSAPPP